MSDYGNVSLRELKEFQENILQLSKVLNEYYTTVNQVLHNTSSNWRDAKFSEFSKDFQRYKDEINNISEAYRDYAVNYLQKDIDNIESFLKTQSIE